MSSSFSAFTSTAPIIITLDGNIGAGKSTLLDAIAKNMPWLTVVPEPVGDWLNMKNDAGESLLSLFYRDTARWCYTFQNCALLTRLMDTERILREWKPEDGKTPILITERSVLTDRYVFAEMLHRQGKMDKLEWELYNKWFGYYAAHLHVKGIIHLATTAETSKERIGIRGRKGEEEIPLSYLADLDAQHQHWIDNSHLPSLQISTEPGSSQEAVLAKVESWIRTQFPDATATATATATK